MPLGFPSSPTLGQQWPAVSPVWEFDGAKWVSIAGTPALATARLASIVATDDLIAMRAGVPHLASAFVVAGYAGGSPVATAPAAYTPGQWSAAATLTPGEISFDLSALPSDGGSAITALQYRVGVGAAVAFTGTGTGVRVVTAGLTAGVAADLQVRAVNAVGAGAWSDVKARTPVASGVVVLQENFPVGSGGGSAGTTTATLTLEQPSVSGSTLILGASTYNGTYTVSDNLGGSSGGGEWVTAVNFSHSGGSIYSWVRRNCPAGITSIQVVKNTNYPADQRLYVREVAGLSNVAAIEPLTATGLIAQNAASIAVSGAGFFSGVVRTSPSRTAESASAGSVVRRLDFSDVANTISYTGPTSEHTIHGIAGGARSFDSSWPDGSSDVGYGGVFIPAA